MCAATDTPAHAQTVSVRRRTRSTARPMPGTPPASPPPTASQTTPSRPTPCDAATTSPSPRMGTDSGYPAGLHRPSATSSPPAEALPIPAASRARRLTGRCPRSMPTRPWKVSPARITARRTASSTFPSNSALTVTRSPASTMYAPATRRPEQRLRATTSR